MSPGTIYEIELSPSDRRGIFLFAWYKGGKPWLRFIRRVGGWANLFLGGLIVAMSAILDETNYLWLGSLNLLFGIYFLARPYVYLFFKRKQLQPTTIKIEFQESSLKFTDENGASALLYEAIENVETRGAYWMLRIRNGPTMFFPLEKLSEAEWAEINAWAEKKGKLKD